MDKRKRRQIALMELDFEKTDGCWNWQGRLNKSGYGITGVRGSSMLAHRTYWQLVVGKISDGMCLLHSCDNKRCVNPKHLREGTHSENMKEAKERGLFKGSPGEKNPKAKLTYQDVYSIRSDKESSNVSLAKIYGVTDVSISNIRKRKTWKHC